MKVLGFFRVVMQMQMERKQSFWRDDYCARALDESWERKSFRIGKLRSEHENFISRVKSCVAQIEET